MSQTTCCPACQTLFKVVPDQLRVSEGWVRCGQCSEIFDAHLHIYKEPFSPEAQRNTPRNNPRKILRNDPREMPPETAQESDTAFRGASYGIDTLKTEPVPLRVEQEAGPDASASIDSFEAVKTNVLQTPLQVQEDAVDPTAQEPWEPRVAGRRRKAKADAGTDVGKALSGTSSEVSFLRVPNGNVFWRRMWVRTSLVLFGTALAAALALQAILHQRDRLAVTLPATKPALQGLCQLLGCRVLPLRQIESMVIDGSTFTELRGNAYRLGFTVKNNAAIDLAMPAIELTLTDSQDRAALRRVFLPAEMGATSTVLGAGAEWAGSLVLAVRTNGASERISGYRIAAIYP